MTGRRRGRPGRAVAGLTVGLAALTLPVIPAIPAPPTAAAAGPAPTAVLAADTFTTGTPGSTTTAPPETTTVPPPTTTTVPVTTTEPATTTRPDRSTTTVEPSTSTTTRPTATTPSATPWGLIVLIIVLVAAIVGVILLLGARRRRTAEDRWRRAVVPALSDARLARESLASGNAGSEDPMLRAAVAVQVEKAAVELDRIVGEAPDEHAGDLARSSAAALRGLAFAIEADRLLRHGTTAPSGMQLAQADEARRSRASELDTALLRLSTRIGPAPATAPR